MGIVGGFMVFRVGSEATRPWIEYCDCYWRRKTCLILEFNATKLIELASFLFLSSHSS